GVMPIIFASAIIMFPGQLSSMLGQKYDIFNRIALMFAPGAILYLVFYFGNHISRYIFTFAGTNIDNVYSFKGTASPLRIALLMLLIIGPGEELFWRAFVQRRLQTDFGKWKGFIIASLIYTLVHVASGNMMLVLAAGVCGFFWGYLYYRTNSVLLNVISHTIWDLGIFILLPMNY
ncbi:MAG: CPBP family intramembrane metalloprotease, partial [Calditrichia bacterium]|nr:CPBP family intramembrane metalloprotease [Calditrichia bacterium]